MSFGWLVSLRGGYWGLEGLVVLLWRCRAIGTASCGGWWFALAGKPPVAPGAFGVSMPPVLSFCETGWFVYGCGLVLLFDFGSLTQPWPWSFGSGGPFVIGRGSVSQMSVA